MIRIIVNNEEQEIEENANIFLLLSVNNITELKGLAVAINNNVISKSEWQQHQLKQGDKITIISATAGG